MNNFKLIINYNEEKQSNSFNLINLCFFTLANFMLLKLNTHFC